MIILSNMDSGGLIKWGFSKLEDGRGRMEKREAKKKPLIGFSCLSSIRLDRKKSKSQP